MNKHIPTDEELNSACAIACGHKVFYADSDTAQRFPLYIPSGKPRRTHMIDVERIRDYCNDRNALPELWEKLNQESATVWQTYWETIRWRLPEPPVYYSDYTRFAIWMQAPTRLHVIAALKALSAWKEEWESE